MGNLFNYPTLKDGSHIQTHTHFAIHSEQNNIKTIIHHYYN